MSAHLDFIDAAGPQLRRWLVAGAVMAAMHATAGALALMTWPEEETVEDTNGAFLLEIAPVPVSPPTEKLNLAAGPRTDEVAAASAIAPTPAVQEKSDVETPKVAEAPLAPRPEVIVQKQQLVEKPDDKKVKEDPRPTQVNVEQSSRAPQRAKAPPPIEAPPAAVPAAAKQGISSKPSEATLSWQKALAMHLAKHKHYPSEARDHGDEGVATVWLSIDRSGKVLSTRLVATSGSQLLDKEAIEVLSRASPLPHPPPEMGDLAINFSLPIHFRIPH